MVEKKRYVGTHAFLIFMGHPSPLFRVFKLKRDMDKSKFATVKKTSPQ